MTLAKRSKSRLLMGKFLLVLLASLYFSCSPWTHQTKEISKGQCLLYLSLTEEKPIPPLTFFLREVWLEDTTGGRHWLFPVTTSVQAKSLEERQILLAKGDAPPGRYRRLCLNIEGALLHEEKGGRPLALSDEGHFCWEVYFSIKEGHTIPLFLTWSPLSSLKDGTFMPSMVVQRARVGLRKRLLFASLMKEGRVAVIDCGGPRVIATIDVASNPRGMALSPYGEMLYVVCQGGNELGVIDIMKNELTESVSLGAGIGPTDLIQLAGKLFVTMMESNSVVVLDPSSKSTLEVIEVGKGPLRIASDPEGHYLYVACSRSDEVVIIDPWSYRVVKRVAVGGEPRAVALDRRYLYVASYRTDTLTMIERRNMTPVATIYCPQGPSAVTVGSMMVYVAAKGTDDLVILDPFTRTVVRRIPMGEGPQCLSIDSKGKILYVGHEDGTVRAVDLIKERTVAELQVGQEVSHLLFAGD